MKTELTIEESAKLIELGVDAKLASGTYVGRWEHYSNGSYPDPDSIEPIFTLTDILAIIPRVIYSNTGGFWLRIDTDKCGYFVYYVDYGINDDGTSANDPEPYSDSLFIKNELIDALNQLLIWCINNRHYNPKNEEK